MGAHRSRVWIVNEAATPAVASERPLPLARDNVAHRAAGRTIVANGEAEIASAVYSDADGTVERGIAQLALSHCTCNAKRGLRLTGWMPVRTTYSVLIGEGSHLGPRCRARV